MQLSIQRVIRFPPPYWMRAPQHFLAFQKEGDESVPSVHAHVWGTGTGDGVRSSLIGKDREQESRGRERERERQLHHVNGK